MEKHVPPPPYCQNCYRPDFTGNKPDHPCFRVDIPPPGLMTPERVANIEKRAERTKSKDEQWRYFYRTIFPGMLCPNPYVYIPVEPLDVQNYCFHEERAKKLLREGWPEGLPVQIEGFFFEWFLPRFCSPFLPTDGGGFPGPLPENLARDEAPPANPVLRDQTVKDRIPPQVTGTYDWQCSLDSTGSGFDVGGDANTASELLDILSPIELDNHDERQGLSDGDGPWLYTT